MSTYKIIQLNRRHTAVHTRDDLLGDRNGVDMVHVKTIAQSRDASCDLVELHTLHTTI